VEGEGESSGLGRAAAVEVRDVSEAGASGVLTGLQADAARRITTDRKRKWLIFSRI
jgi:hypothetical protein